MKEVIITVDIDNSVLKALMNSFGNEETRMKLEKYDKSRIINFLITAKTIGCFDSFERDVELFNEGNAE
jgi:hypothetical protein